jgi:MerR family transcriptional regulator, heat shock protein HspR
MVSFEWGDRDRALFGISVVAELAGLHPHTLRAYEREGLLSPARTGGGTRRYSLNDLARLQEITSLSAEGFNLAGIKRILAMQEETRRLRDEVATLRQRLSDPDDQRGRQAEEM